MARRQNRSNTESNQSNTATVTNEEAPVSTDAPEQTEEQNTPTETPTEAPTEEKAAAKKPIDLTAFKAAVADAVEAADDTTGKVPDANVHSVTGAYRQLEGAKAKNAAKEFVNEGMQNSMDEGNLGLARAYLDLSKTALVAGASGVKAERVPADPTEAFVQRVGTLNLASILAQSSVPEGVNDDWTTKVDELVATSSDQAEAYVAWLDADEGERGDEPEASVFVKNAVKLSRGKAARAGSTRASSASATSYAGPRRDTAKHILNAFADKPVGTFMKIGEIVKVPSAEYEGDSPSQGAISSRLFPKDKDGNPKESKLIGFGIQPDSRDGNQGAVKVAEYDAE